jgi:hypothetical protein
MQTIQVPQVSNKALWAGRIMSAIVILFLIPDAVIKLVPLDIVIETSRELGIPEHLARTLGVLTLIGVLLYAWPRTSILGAIVLTGYLGGAIYVHVRAGSPMLSHTLFGVYLGLLIWGGLYLRDGMVRALIPLRQSAG